MSIDGELHIVLYLAQSPLMDVTQSDGRAFQRLLRQDVDGQSAAEAAASADDDDLCHGDSPMLVPRMVASGGYDHLREAASQRPSNAAGIDGSAELPEAVFDGWFADQRTGRIPQAEAHDT